MSGSENAASAPASNSRWLTRRRSTSENAQHSREEFKRRRGPPKRLAIRVDGKPPSHTISLDAASPQAERLRVIGAPASGKHKQVSKQLQPAHASPDHHIKPPIVYLGVWSGGQCRTEERANGKRDRERAPGGSTHRP